MNSSTNIRKIFFRLDCGGLIGMGHLSRCLSVACEFSKNGIEPIFIIRKRPSIATLQIPFKVVWLNEAPDIVSLNPDDWIVGSSEKEYDELVECIDEQDQKSFLVFLDHYGLKLEWQKKLRLDGYKLILFQDIFSREIEADILINYNFGSKTDYDKDFGGNRYPLFLLGPTFAPLNENYAKEHYLHFAEETLVERVGIYLGGVKSEYLTLVASVIKQNNYFKNKKIEWVVNIKDEVEILNTILKDHNLIIHIALPGLIPLYQRSQLFIGACGVSFLERVCMGLWHINFIVANNQYEVAASIESNNLGFIVGDIRNLNFDTLNEKLNDILAFDNSTILGIIEKSFSQVNGLGAKEIVKNCLEFTI